MKRWKPELAQGYYYILSTMKVIHTLNTDSIDDLRIRFHNCFETKEEAQTKLKEIKKVMRSR